jgi:glutaredoxin
LEEASPGNDRGKIIILTIQSPIEMRASIILRQQWSLRMTLFIRQNCSLCTDAKDVMSKVWDRRPFEYTEIDVMAANQTKWKNLYEFDTPVVRLLYI